MTNIYLGALNFSTRAGLLHAIGNYDGEQVSILWQLFTWAYILEKAFETLKSYYRMNLIGEWRSIVSAVGVEIFLILSVYCCCVRRFSDLTAKRDMTAKVEEYL